MRPLLRTSILLLTIYTYNSCSICSCKKVSCPAFDDVNFWNWFAYQPGQQIIFKYQLAYDTISLLPFHKNEAYEANQGCYNGSDGCNQHISINSQEFIPNSGLKFFINYASLTAFGSSVTEKSVTLFLRGFNCTASDINDQGLVLQPGQYNSTYSPSLPINGTSFNNVQTITRDTIGISAQQPYKVYLSKGTGLIAYEMFPSHELWVKQ